MASALAIVDAGKLWHCLGGNEVRLSDRNGVSYIENVKMGEHVYLRKTGGTFVFDVDFEDYVQDAAAEDVPMNGNVNKKWFQSQGAAR